NGGSPIINGYANTYFEVAPSDVNGQTAGDNGTINFGTTPFAPIGTWDRPFKGNLEGNGCTLQNLIINKDGNEAGLFGCVIGSTIKNLKIGAGSSILGKIQVGGFVGCLKDGGGSTLDNLTIEAGVSISAQCSVGGIVGLIQAAKSTISNCENFGSVSSTDVYTIHGKNGAFLGGIVGLVRSDGKFEISNCKN
ncbi:MAG: hypothetical protein RR405_06265, partial [Clostridia bacterium]